MTDDVTMRFAGGPMDFVQPVSTFQRVLSVGSGVVEGIPQGGLHSGFVARLDRDTGGRLGGTASVDGVPRVSTTASPGGGVGI